VIPKGNTRYRRLTRNSKKSQILETSASTARWEYGASTCPILGFPIRKPARMSQLVQYYHNADVCASPLTDHQFIHPPT
jgi:hypothetical protein